MIGKDCARPSRQAQTARLVSDLKGQPLNRMTKRQALLFGIFGIAFAAVVAFIEAVA